MIYFMLVSALHFRCSTPSTAVYCRYPSDPIYKYLLAYTTAKFEELALEMWLAWHNSVSCLYAYICAWTHRYLHLSTCTSICPSFHLWITPSTALPICIRLSIRPFSSVCLYASLYNCISIDPSNNPSIHPTIDPFKIRNSVSSCDRNYHIFIKISPIFSTYEKSVPTRRTWAAEWFLMYLLTNI